MWPECRTQRNRSRVEGDKRTEAHGAAKIPPGCVGRCDRSALRQLEGSRLRSAARLSSGAECRPAKPGQSGGRELHPRAF